MRSIATLAFILTCRQNDTNPKNRSCIATPQSSVLSLRDLIHVVNSLFIKNWIWRSDMCSNLCVFLRKYAVKQSEPEYSVSKLLWVLFLYFRFVRRRECTSLFLRINLANYHVLWVSKFSAKNHSPCDSGIAVGQWTRSAVKRRTRWLPASLISKLFWLQSTARFK